MSKSDEQHVDDLADLKNSEKKSAEMPDEHDKRVPPTRTETMPLWFWVAVTGGIIMAMGCLFVLLAGNSSQYIHASMTNVWVLENHTGTKCVMASDCRICAYEVPYTYYTVALALNGDRSRVVCTIPYRLATMEAVALAVHLYSEWGFFYPDGGACRQDEASSKMRVMGDYTGATNDQTTSLLVVGGVVVLLGFQVYMAGMVMSLYTSKKCQKMRTANNE